MPPSPTTDSMRYTEMLVPGPSRIGGSSAGARGETGNGAALVGVAAVPTAPSDQRSESVTHPHVGQLRRPAGKLPAQATHCCQVSSPAMAAEHIKRRPARKRANAARPIRDIRAVLASSGHATHRLGRADRELGAPLTEVG